MEATVWPEERAVAYQFFQWARLCDESMDLSKRTIFRPTASFSFTVSDFSVNEKAIEIHFLSLLGAMSPLPHHFNTPMLSPCNESEAFYAFIAMLNSIFYRALYAAWKSNHVLLFKKQRGLYHEMFIPFAPTPWLSRPYLQYVPTLMGLRVLLYRMCGDTKVAVDYESGFQRLSSVLGTLSDPSPRCLSDNAILGSRVLSHEGKLLLTVGPVPCVDARGWLSTGVQGKNVLAQARHYIGVGFELKWKVVVASQETVARLGYGDALSRYAFLGKSGQLRVI